MTQPNNSNQIFSGLPSWARGVIAVAVVGGVGFIVYKLYKKLNEGLELDLSDKVVEENNEQLNDLKNQGQTLSRPLADYQALSNYIVTALNDCESSETEINVANSIVDIVKKPIDWFHLVKVFGSRMIQDCGYGESPYALPQLIKEQLGQGYYVGIPTAPVINPPNYEIVTNHLKKLGITI